MHNPQGVRGSFVKTPTRKTYCLMEVRPMHNPQGVRGSFVKTPTRKNILFNGGTSNA